MERTLVHVLKTEKRRQNTVALFCFRQNMYVGQLNIFAALNMSINALGKAENVDFGIQINFSKFINNGIYDNENPLYFTSLFVFVSVNKRWFISDHWEDSMI